MRRNFFRIVVILMAALFSTVGGAFAQKKSISFWTTEIDPKRMEIQKGLSRRFAESSGPAVDIIPVKGSELAQRVSDAAASGKLPDIILVPLELLSVWSEKEVLDPKPASRVVDELGENSFAAGPLRLAKVEEGWGAVPADGWGQLLLYRKDLFVGKGIDAMLGIPETWNKILEAAHALHDPPRLYAIAVPTDTTQDYAQQILEQLALSNDAPVLDPISGKVVLNSPEFVQALQFYKKLASFSPPGPLSRQIARELYLAGRLAMVIGSPMMLDEMAGLDGAAAATLKGAKKPVHELTGVVSDLRGPMGSRPVQWGQVNYFGFTTGANPESVDWVQFLVGEGYLEWLGMAPEAKLPLRPEFHDGWKDLKIGTGRKAALSELYSDGAINRILGGVEHFDRWGYAARKGGCMGQLHGTGPLLRLLRRYLDGEISAESAAEMMAAEAEKMPGCR